MRDGPLILIPNDKNKGAADAWRTWVELAGYLKKNSDRTRSTHSDSTWVPAMDDTLAERPTQTDPRYDRWAQRGQNQAGK